MSVGSILQSRQNSMGAGSLEVARNKQLRHAACLAPPSKASSCAVRTATASRRPNVATMTAMIQRQALAPRRQPMPGAKRAARASPFTAPAPSARDRRAARALPTLARTPALDRVHPYFLTYVPSIRMPLPNRRWRRLRHRLLRLRATQALALAGRSSCRCALATVARSRRPIGFAHG